jgi:hypothetical protein
MFSHMINGAECTVQCLKLLMGDVAFLVSEA